MAFDVSPPRGLPRLRRGSPHFAHANRAAFPDWCERAGRSFGDAGRAAADRRPRAGPARRQPHRPAVHRRLRRRSALRDAAARSASRSASTTAGRTTASRSSTARSSTRCAACRPQNKPTPQEIAACRPYLASAMRRAAAPRGDRRARAHRPRQRAARARRAARRVSRSRMARDTRCAVAARPVR